MKLTTQKRIAAQLLKCGENRVWFDEKRLSEIKEAITKADIRSLISDFAIQKKAVNAISGFRKRKSQAQKKKGRRTGQGSRKGRKNARHNSKENWIKKIRAQRTFLKQLKDGNKVPAESFKDMYRKSKGGYFRSIGHIKLYMEEHKIGQNESKQSQSTGDAKKARRKN